MDKVQGCSRMNMILTPAFLIGGAIVILVWKGPMTAVVYTVILLLYVFAYRRFFPRISKYLGYGELKDEQ